MRRKESFVNGEYYHVYNRGIDKRIIFKMTTDYERFLELLYIGNSLQPVHLDILINKLNKNYKDILIMDREKPLVSIGGWCLMPNHFHLLLKQETDGGITKFMKRLGTGYSMYFNGKYKRQGALFGGVFKSKLIGEDKYLKHLFGYVHLNPLEIKFSEWETTIKYPKKEMVDYLGLYNYSSYPDYVGVKRLENNILNVKAFPGYFRATKQFRDFIEAYLTSEDRPR